MDFTQGPGSGTDHWESEAVVRLGKYTNERTAKGACSAYNGGDRAQSETIP